MPAWQAEMAARYTLRVEAAFPSSNNCCRNSSITPSAQLMESCCRAAHHCSKLLHFSVYRACVDTARALCIVATTASDKPDAKSLHHSGWGCHTVLCACVRRSLRRGSSQGCCTDILTRSATHGWLGQWGA